MTPLQRLLPLLPLLLSACFVGKTHVTVQAFGGETLPLELRPDPREVIATALAVEDRCFSVAQDVDLAFERAKEAIDVSRRFAEVFDSKVTPEIRSSLETLAPAYLEVWRTNNPLLTSRPIDEPALRTALGVARDNLAPQHFTLSGVDMRDYLRHALGDSLKLDRMGRPWALFKNLELALAAPDEDLQGLLKAYQVEGGEDPLSSLTLALAELTGIDTENPKIPKIMDTLGESLVRSEDQLAQFLKSTNPEGPIYPKLDSVKDARSRLVEAAYLLAKPNQKVLGAEAEYANLLRCSIDLQSAADELGNELSKQLETLQPESLNSSWDETLFNFFGESRWSEAVKLAAPEILRELVSRQRVRGDLELSASITSVIRSARGALTRAISGAAALRELASNPVDAIRSQPFVAADPNIKMLTNPANERFWRTIPIDALCAKGDGLTQFIIVQDGPTTYRLKELHVDPLGVVNFQLSVADVGLDLVSVIAETQLGVKLPGGEGEKDIQEVQSAASDSALAEQERLLSDALRDALASLVTFLRTEAEANGNGTELLTPEALARIQGRLRGDAARLRALHEAASRRLKPTPGEYEAPPPVEEFTPSDDQ